MIKLLTNSTLLVLILFFTINTVAISCEDKLQIAATSIDEMYCDGDIVKIQVCGYWLGGGISSNVNEDLSYWGDIEVISESNNYPCIDLEIRIDSERFNVLKVRYDFEIEANQFEDYQSCSITESYTFNVKSNFVSCEGNIAISATDLDGPFCDGDIVTMEVCGNWLGGDINAEVNEDLSYSGDIDIISESSNHPCKVLEIRMDSKKQNNLEVRYDFEIEATLFQKTQTCSISKTFTFEVIPSLIIDDFSLKWRQGDILEVENNHENICYQWGEVIDNEEVDIIGETSNEFSPNSSVESIFISSIKDKKPIPKDDFKRNFYVRLYDCDVADAQCDKTFYFTPENFDYVPFYDGLNLSQLEYNIYPNPGDGKINISASGKWQDSTPSPTIVTDANGNRLPTSNLIYAWDGTYIDISTAPSGFYFIYFKTGDETFEKFRYYKN